MNPRKFPGESQRKAGKALTAGLVGAVHVLQVALQLEGRAEVAVAVLADGVHVHLSILLVQLHVVLHVVHEPAGTEFPEIPVPHPGKMHSVHRSHLGLGYSWIIPGKFLGNFSLGCS